MPPGPPCRPRHPPRRLEQGSSRIHTDWKPMDKQVIKADVPETGGPFNLCVRYGNLIFISGLPPFEEDYAARLRAARAAGAPIPPFPDIPFERQVRIVMDHLKRLVEAAGSNMD